MLRALIEETGEAEVSATCLDPPGRSIMGKNFRSLFECGFSPCLLFPSRGVGVVGPPSETRVKLFSDNGLQFISDIFENLSERLGIRHVKTVVYRPEANRTANRVNRDLVQMIANYVYEEHDTWDQFLREFADAICTAVKETTGNPWRIIFRSKVDYAFSEISDGIRRNGIGSLYRVLDVMNNNVVIWKAGKRKKSRKEETVTPTTSNYNLRPRNGKGVEPRPTILRKTQQGGPVRSRKGRGRNDGPYIVKRTR
ncbi:hypothetical protein TNCV_5055521 [Trichonephila clavipes]|nr:hypothetical protein TNCV_5055521 [Trichonephila clavipes]